ncbi:MAG: cytochrome c biogenesis protein CcdA [Pseudarthrobacter sp.]|nr:cytochrome c biogenesis protein CcdA [Pseudarthrobacter sp.]
MTGTLAFAFGAGMLSTVNPCGFAMLPAFLAYYIGRDDTATGSAGPGLLRRAFSGLGAGALVSLGFAGIFTLTGLLVAFGLRSIIGDVPWVAVLIGVLLAGVGIAMLAGRRVGLTLNSNRINRPGRGPGSMIAFGAAYAVASLSCTLAVLLAVIAQALAANSITALVSVFVAYAGGASMVLILLALSSALASGALAKGLHRASRFLPRVAGAVLVLSGAYLVAYWAPALATGQPNQGIAGGMNVASSAVTGFIGANTTLIAVLALSLATAVLLAALGTRKRTARPVPKKPEDDCCAPAAEPHVNSANHSAADLNRTTPASRDVPPA